MNNLFIIIYIVNNNNKMDVVTDPQTYENSEIVEKSSKSGIFSNKRLLVIKNGFLYYFTNVPKNYKTHLPNILNTFKELPKSSIQIKEIQQIKMQSSKSTNLLLKFQQKDMIDRQSIRTSIKNQNFKQSKKGSADVEEWKFTFTTALQCRIWFNALLKLKSHFSKQNNKIQQFFSNFDPNKRNSKLPPQIQSIFAVKKEPAQDTNLVKQFQQEDKKKQGKKVQEKSPLEMLLPLNNTQSPKKEQIPKVQEKKQEKKEEVHVEKKLQQKKVEQKKEQKKEEKEQKKQEKREQKRQVKKQEKKEDNKREQKKDDLKILSSDLMLDVIQEDEQIKNKVIQQEIRQELQEQIRKEEQERVENEMSKMKQELREKDDKINLLQEDLRYIEETQYRFKSKESQIFKRSIQFNEFSVQTDEQQDEPHYTPYKMRAESFVDDFNSTQRETYNLLRMTSISFELDKGDKNYENYDYYSEIGNLYNQETSFNDRIKKQIRLINYVNKMKIVASETAEEYINENKPQHSLTFQGTLFQIKVVCSHGKIVNIGGMEKLVYSNKEHKKLKQQYKIYDYLQSQFVEISRKKSNFPLRVPLTYFVQYKGYSILLRYMPYLKEIDSKEQRKIHKQLKRIVGTDYVDSYSFKKIGNRQLQLYLITTQNPYKITHQNKPIQFSNNETLYGPSMIDEWRMQNISSNSNKIQGILHELSQKGQTLNSKKISSYQNILVCRQVKNLYRSIQPYNENTQHSNNFFHALLTTPEEVLYMLSDTIACEFNGLFVAYLQYFFGFKVQKNFNIYKASEQDFEMAKVQPVIRSFSLSNLSAIKMFNNLNKYIEQEKYNMVQSTIQILNQVESYKRETTLLEMKYSIKKYKNDKEMLCKTADILMKYKHSLQRHDPLLFSCCMLIIQCFSRIGDLSVVLSQIYFTIDYLQYMYGDNLYVQELDYMYLLAAQTLAKMGNLKESTIIYKKLLQNASNMLSTQQISLSFAQIYSNNNNIQSNELLQFLLTLLQNNNKVKSEWQAKMRMHIGEIYLKMHNRDQSIQYFQQAFEFYNQTGVSDQYSADSLFKISRRLLQLYTQRKDKEKVFQAFLKLQQTYSNNQKVSNFFNQVQVDFVTFAFCLLIQDETNSEERKILTQILQEIRDDNKEERFLSSKITYNNISTTIKSLHFKQELGEKQIKVLQQVKISEVQAFLFSL